MGKSINWISEFNLLKDNSKGSFVFIEIDSWLGGGVWAVVEKNTPFDKINEVAQAQYDYYKNHSDYYMRFKNEHTYSN